LSDYGEIWNKEAQSHAYKGFMMKYQISKIQHGGRPPFWKSLSQPLILRFRRHLVCRRKFWPMRRKRDKNSEIPKFKIADGRHIDNHF